MLMSIAGMIIEVDETEYVVIEVNDEDQIVAVSEFTGRQHTFDHDVVTYKPDIEQPEDWIIDRLLEAWEPRIRKIARLHAQRLLSWQKFNHDGQTAKTAARTMERLIEQPRIQIVDQVPVNKESR